MADKTEAPGWPPEASQTLHKALQMYSQYSMIAPRLHLHADRIGGAAL